MRFKLEVTLRCPAILQGFNTLESLLAAAVHEQTGAIREEALAQVPIARDGDVWQASAVFFEGFYGYGDQTTIRRRRNSETGPDYYEGRGREGKKGQWFLDQGTGAYKALLNAYRTPLCRRLVWFADGDADACERLLYSLQSIGKRRGQGFGEIDDVIAFETNESPLVDSRGLVLRPIPLEMLTGVAGAAHQDKQTCDLVAWRHPFWDDGARTICAVPGTQNLDHINQARAASRPSAAQVLEDFFA